MLAPFGTPQAGAGALDGPLAVDNYKRAVYRPPPARFMVDMLPPTKQGREYSFGMRITPIFRGDRSSISSVESKTSQKSNVEYEVWRRWEDCLWFQDTLELEYSRLARMKRQRLLAGKGVKKDGLYLQDRASSWESLPPGPEPNSVAQDIHDIIPKLTKKGTLFRASQATIEQRHSEFSAFVEALFAENVPTLLAELRADRMVTDFFGYWRRDYDLAMKNDHRSGNKPSKPRSSITNSVLSSYFSNGDNNTDTESVPSSRSMSRSPSSPSFRVSRISVSTGAYQYARTTKLKEKQGLKEVLPKRRHTSSSSTSSSGSSSNSRHSMNSIASAIPGIREEVPLTFDHNPRVGSQKDHFLQSLPEDAELPIHSDSESIPSSIRRPKKRSSRDTLYRRSARIFTAPPNTNDLAEVLRAPTKAHWPGTRGTRESWQTTGSASTYLEGLNVAITDSPAHIYHPSRLSIGSIATFMTDNSADAIIPRSRMASTSTPRSSFVRDSRPLSISTLTGDGSWSDGDEDCLNSYIFDAFPMPPNLFPFQEKRRPKPEAQTGFNEIQLEQYVPTSHLEIEIADEQPRSIPEDVKSVTPRSSDLASPLTSVPPSPTASTASTELFSFITDKATDSSSCSGSTALLSSTAVASVLAESLTIKVAHNQSIILLRASRDSEFSDVRQRIYEKFLIQEKVTLTEAFAIAFVLQDISEPRSSKGKGRARSNSLGGGGSQMILLTNQSDWERALATTNSSKITIRVLDTFHQ